MTDPRDPLLGLDPFARVRIDALDLDRERADLLEEIVSTPGPGKQPTARPRILLPIGVAAALAVIGGSAWFAVDHGNDDIEATSAATVTATPTAGGTATSTAGPAATATATSGPKPSRMQQLRRLQCRTTIADMRRVSQLPEALGSLNQEDLRDGKWHDFYLRGAVPSAAPLQIRINGDTCELRRLRSRPTTGPDRP